MNETGLSTSSALHTSADDFQQTMHQLMSEVRRLPYIIDADLSALWSAGERKQEILRYLLENEVKKNRRMLEHLLYQAAEYGDCHDIRLLVDEYGAKEEPVLRYQICRWWYSRTHTPSTNLIRLMADKGSFLEKPHHRFFRKILMRASRYGWIEWVKLMLDWGVDVNCRHARTHTTPLMLAAIGGHPAVFSLLLQAGANVLARDAHGRTAMFFARERWRFPTLREQLLAAGVPDEAPPHVSDLRLMDAVERADLAMVRYQLENGADVNHRSHRSRYTPLMAAAERGASDIVRLLLRAGADPALCDRKGHTALTRALNSASPDAELLRLLRHAG